MRKKILAWMATILLIGGCSTEKADERAVQKRIPHYNIVVVPDLSNRLDNSLYPRQLSDPSVYRVLLRIFPQLVEEYGRIAYQKDKLSLRLLNPLEIQGFSDRQQALTIDFGKFELRQRERIEFLKNKEGAAKTYRKEAADFQQAVEKLYQDAEQNNYGADLWNFFNQTVDQGFFNLHKPVKSQKVQDISRNILIVITDGYIEVGTGGENPCGTKLCQQLTYHQMKALRSHCQKSDLPLPQAFEQSGYGITPVRNPALSNVEVLMLEVYDRSKSKSGSIRHTPSDFKLLQLYWSDFFKKSGVERFKIVETRSSEADLEQSIRTFLAPTE